MTASKSKILAIAMIVAVALFLALFSIFASSFSNRDETAAEPSPTTAPTPPRTICFIGGDLSDATQYDLAKKIGFLVGDMSGYTYKLYDAAGSAATQVALIDEAMATEPAYLIIDPVEADAEGKVGGRIVTLEGVGVINVDGNAAFIGADDICNVVYDMEEAARLSAANGNCPITADAAVIAQVEDGGYPAGAVYLDNAELARAVASAISNAGGGTAMTGATLEPQLVTMR